MEDDSGRPPRDRRTAAGWLARHAGDLRRLPGRLRSLAGDPRVPLRAKLLLGLLALYLMNPIDLIPDFIPVLGYLDDVLVAAAILALAARSIPTEVWREHFGTSSQ